MIEKTVNITRNDCRHSRRFFGHYARWFFLGFLLLISTASLARAARMDDFFGRAFRPFFVATPERMREHSINEKQSASKVNELCAKLDQVFQNNGWAKEPCAGVEWKTDQVSRNGSALLYASFGEGPITTLVLSGVHPDEMTPIPLAFRFAQYIASSPAGFNKQATRVIVAPIVNPDGFLLQHPTRTNANGIDLNRNFLTTDWYDSARKLWMKWKSRNSEHFPGFFPNSELETLFQIRLIEKFSPQKIVSIHAPLGFIDYDGPGDDHGQASGKDSQPAEMVHQFSQLARNFRVIDYNYYPGSLGNFAGNERRIPTITLELDSVDPKKVDSNWERFGQALFKTAAYQIGRMNPVDHSLSLFFGEETTSSSRDSKTRM